MNIDQSITKAIQKYSKNKTVLDLGGYNGGECNIAMEAGAKSAICVDDESWKTYDNWHEFRPYPDVIYVKDNFMNYTKPAQLVILKNVIYHQRNPWKTLEHVRTLTTERLLLATSYVEGDEPMWRVYAPYEGHPVSWTVAWRPTKAGLIKLLQSTGFKDIEVLTERDHWSMAVMATPGKVPIGFGERN